MVDIDDEKANKANSIRGNGAPFRIGPHGKIKANLRGNSKSDQMAAPPYVPLESLAHVCGLTPQWVRWDKTAHGWHVTIKVRQKLTLSETIAAQAILGSDRKREMLNLARCISIRKRPSRYWEQRANILYESKIR
jgi:hypothetical protein